METFRVVYRAIVMACTLVVGAMAYRAYGPELEKLGPVLTRAKQELCDAMSPTPSSLPPVADAEPAPPEQFLPPAGPMVHAPAAPPLVDPQVQPAGGQEEILPATAAEDSSPVARVVRELASRGVEQYALTPWGEEGRFYRFHCSAPWGGSAGFTRHFEAITADPVLAAEQVLEQVTRWQTASSDQPLRR